MKRSLRYYFVVAFAVLLVRNNANSQKIKSDYMKQYDFGALKRFEWQKNELITGRHPEDNIVLDRKIMRLVTQELAAKGIVEDASNPDIYLYYHAGIGDDISGIGSSPTAGGIMQPQAANFPPASTWGSGAGSSAGFAPKRAGTHSEEGQGESFSMPWISKLTPWFGRAERPKSGMTSRRPAKTKTKKSNKSSKNLSNTSHRMAKIRRV